MFVSAERTFLVFFFNVSGACIILFFVCAVNCLERLISKMTYYVSSRMLIHNLSQLKLSSGQVQGQMSKK